MHYIYYLKRRNQLNFWIESSWFDLELLLIILKYNKDLSKNS